MARLRKADATASADGVPAELRDPQHAVWRTEESAENWRRKHRVVRQETSGLTCRTPTTISYHRAVADWAITNGITNRRWPEFADWPRLQAMGIPARQPSLERAMLRGRGKA